MKNITIPNATFSQERAIKKNTLLRSLTLFTSCMDACLPSFHFLFLLHPFFGGGLFSHLHFHPPLGLLPSTTPPICSWNLHKYALRSCPYVARQMNWNRSILSIDSTLVKDVDCQLSWSMYIGPCQASGSGINSCLPEDSCKDHSIMSQASKHENNKVVCQEIPPTSIW